MPRFARRFILAALPLTTLLLLACTEDVSSDGDGGEGGTGGSSETSSNGGATSGPSSTSATTSTSTTSSAATTSSGGTDPYDAARQACVDKINELRATKGLPPYARWQSAEACVDQEVTYDQSIGQAHAAFFATNSCGAGGQGECMGFDHSAEGITSCLQYMWNEKDYPECVNCDACPFGQDCDGCIFLSCGHYMAMSSPSFTEAACGFSEAVPGWQAIDYR
jgi:hypothetical protein